MHMYMHMHMCMYMYMCMCMHMHMFMLYVGCMLVFVLGDRGEIVATRPTPTSARTADAFINPGSCINWLPVGPPAPALRTSLYGRLLEL